MMRNKVFLVIFFSIVLMLFYSCNATKSSYLSQNVKLIDGNINGVVISSEEKKLIIYGDPENSISNAELILFTDARRDITHYGNKLIQNGTKVIVPKNELCYFTKTDSIWNSISKTQSHDYKQKSIKVPIKPIQVFRSVEGGDTITWNNVEIEVIDSKGYTEGAVSYIANIDDIKIAFVGNMIYGEGQLMDIYSLQNEIPELNIWGYHGYAARIHELINSLQRIKEAEPDMIIPVRGAAIIKEPKETINKLIYRLRSLYQNYLSVNSFKWYRDNGWGSNKDEHKLLANRVLTSDMQVDWMPYAETKENPSWLIHIENSKLIVSKDSTAFLIDCGIKNVYEKLMNLEDNFSCRTIEGVFISHYHDDHTDYINKIKKEYDCPVYITKELKDILNKPEAYYMPAMTSERIKDLTIIPNRTSITWKEFKFTFYYFPGQTIYHDAMLVENRNGEKIFLVGDSFSPSGMDDYCLQNRNVINSEKGYLYCLDILKSLPEDTWLVNQHVEFPFKYSSDQLNFMKNNLIKRGDILSELFPWDDLNYGIDNNWAVIYPYKQEVKLGDSVKFSVVIFNYSDKVQDFTVRPNVGNLSCFPEEFTIEIPPMREGKADFRFNTSTNITLSNKIITAEIEFGKWKLPEWCESIIEVKDN